MKHATLYSKTNVLYYWTSRNTMEYVNCSTKERAIQLINNSNVKDQKLIVSNK